MPQTPPKWLRERIENNEIYSGGGTWKAVALLAGILTVVGTVFFLLWRNLANFP